MIKTERLSVSLAGSQVVRDVTLEVPAKSAAALVGPNGAGKTTTLRAIMGLLKHGGRVQVGGVDATAMGPRERAMLGLGYSPEDRRLFPSLTVAENLELAVSALGLPRDRLELVYGLMPILKELARRRAGELSGGQQKLVALARAMAVGTKAALLDEVFEGLSPKMRDDVSLIVREFIETAGAAVLMAESNPDYVKFAHVIYKIQRGVASPLK
ncbi:MAG: ATP-binding cassette domain-containing protein [Thermoproteus sp.]|jgi:branched-chain amino acid transport system ATP-binding protein